MMKVLSLALLTGCIGPWWSWDVGVRPEAAEGSENAWVFEVDMAADLWGQKLSEAGCRVYPFDGSAGTHPVYLRDPADYERDNGTDSIGLTWPDRIEIKAGDPVSSATLLHEMGHALGLEHVSYDDDPTSVMHAQADSIYVPDDLDVRHVMERLGCL